jgi:glycosyltransferase involved in cell wall biosynthesis
MTVNSKIIISSNDLFKCSKIDSTLLKPSELNEAWFKKYKRPNLSFVNLLYLGRLRKEKGIFNLISLLKYMKINYQLKVVGLETDIKNFQEEKISYYYQEFNIEKIIEYYDHCNIFILPSYTESAPKVVWESLARLRPVIIFKDIRHVAYKKKGVYVCDRTVLSLTNKINFIMKNYHKIQNMIKKNHFPLKAEFQKEFLNIVNKI